MKAKSRQAFTLVELLTVIAIISLLISILLPALGRAREMGHRAVCLANQAAIMKGIQVYSKESEGKLPVWGQRDPGFLSMGQEWGTDADYLSNNNLNNAGMAGSVHSNTRNYYILIRQKLADPKNFICSSDPDAQAAFNPADPTRAYDFQHRGQVSFSMQYLGPTFNGTGTSTNDIRTGWQMSLTDDPRTVILGDKSPLIEPRQPIQPQAAATGYFYDLPLGTGTSTFDQFCKTLADVEGLATINTDGKFLHGLTPPDRVLDLNSQNHKGEGQNIARLDGSAAFVVDPWQGAAGDNIYTVEDKDNINRDAQKSAIARACGVFPTSTLAGATTEIQMLSHWMAVPRSNKTDYPDSFLVP